MALISYSDVLTIDLSDKIAGTVTLKKKAEFQSLTFSAATKSVIVSVIIRVFAPAVDGTYGISLSQVPGFADYQKSIVANLSDLVELPNGNILGPSSLLLNPVNSADATYDAHGVLLTPAGVLFDKDYMYEFDFYKKVAAEMPVVINDLITAKILEADGAGRL